MRESSAKVLQQSPHKLHQELTPTPTHTNTHLRFLSSATRSFSTKAGRNTGHDVSHSVEWATTAINSWSGIRVWRTGGGNWWDHTSSYGVCVHVCAWAYIAYNCARAHTQEAEIWEKGSQTDIMQTWRRTSWQNSREVTEKRVWTRLTTSLAVGGSCDVAWRERAKGRKNEEEQTAGMVTIMWCHWHTYKNQRCNGTVPPCMTVSAFKMLQYD